MRAGMQKVSGDTCPKCGCTRGKRVGSLLFGDEDEYERECAHCGEKYAAKCIECAEIEQETPTVRFNMFPTCPHCGHKRAVATTTHRKSKTVVTRMYRCSGCEKKFRTVGEC